MWTYSDCNLGQGGKDDVRALIGDMLPSDPQVTDEQIRLFLDQRGTVYGAAAACCLMLATKFARSVDQVAGSSKISFSQMAIGYRRMWILFEQTAASMGIPYAGGISLADKMNQEMDSDRKDPEFTIGLSDVYLPVSPIGPETETSAGKGRTPWP